MNRLLVVISLAVAAWSPSASAAYDSGNRPDGGELTVLRATPTGDGVLAERQVVFTFNRPVVPLGEMARTAAEVDATVEPALACEWRWLDTSSLACNLGDSTRLRMATRYRFTIGTKLKAEDGASLAKPFVHEFVTQRPTVERWVPFAEWRTPGMPVVRVAFGAPVVVKTVKEHMYFKVGGERVATVFEAAEADRPRDPDAPRPAPQSPPDTTRVLLARPAADVAPDTKVELWVEPGIRFTEGDEASDERRVLVSTWTFPLPRFLGIRCINANGDRALDINVDAISQGRCDPMRQVALRFATPVLPDEVKDKMRFTPDLAGGRTDFDPWAPDEEEYGYSEYDSYSGQVRPHERGNEYLVAIPTLLRADEAHHLTAAAGAVEDQFGRPIAGAIDFTFNTAPRPPRFVFEHTVAALEKNADSEIPVVVNNIDRITTSYRTLTLQPSTLGALTKSAERDLVLSAPQVANTDLPKVKDVAYYRPLGIRALLGGKSGVVTGAVKTSPNTSPSWNRSCDGVCFVTQVTPWQVHVKYGHFNGLVWVTDMTTGKPVAGARVRVMVDQLRTLGDGQVLATVTTDKDGLAELPGALTLDPDRKLGGWGDDATLLVVYADRGEDLAVVPLHYDFRTNIYSSGVWSNERRHDGHARAWGTTAQGVYRPGDTVQWKVWVRNQDNRTLTAAPRDGYTLEIVDPTDETVQTLSNLSLDAFGGLHGEFPVAATAPIGWYSFRLSNSAMEMRWDAMRVLVTEFTPAPFRVTNEVAGTAFQPNDLMETSTHARLHAGGPYGQADARVTVTLTPTALVVTDPAARGFQFDTGPWRGEDDYEGGGWGTVQLFQGEGELDAQGDLALRAPMPDNDVMFGRLTIESAVRDDRGKYMAGVTSATWYGRDRFVGLRTDRWMYNAGTPASVEWLVVDEKGARVAGSEVALTVEQRVTTGARVKGAGNAYLMRYTHSWEPVTACNGAATLAAQRCTFTPAKAGLYRVIASLADTRGRAHRTERHLWVTGAGAVLWEDDNTGALRLVPEKSAFKVGEKARVMVQNPMPGATALITLERYGVLKRWTQKLEGSAPVIEIPVGEDMVPGAYLSVAIASPRVDKPLEAGQVDLGKPTLRLGYLQLMVDDEAKRLAVRAIPAKAEYRPQDEVTVDLRVGPKFAGLGEPVQYAVVVLDEAVFDLIQGGDRYYDPHKGMWSLDGLDLSNFNLLQTLVGRQKFEKKGANPGGDGGFDVTPRSDFRFVAYWNPALQAGPDGKATITFKVPDNLTGWRVIAMAVNAKDRLGVGVANFKVNRPTEVRPVMPNQVTQGDRFDAAFSVMNRTANPRTVAVKVGVTGALAAEQAATLESTLTLEPYARGIVKMPVQTAGAGALAFKVTAGDALDRDGLAHTVPVKPQRVTETATDWGTTFVPRTLVSLKVPKDIRPDAGSMGVTVSATVLGNLDGAFKYLRDYPYWCWEQRLTKGVAAMHFSKLGAYLGPQVTWPDAATYPRQMLDDAASFQAPNGGMTYWVPNDRYTSPYLSAYTARAFGWMRRSGLEPPAAVERRLDGYLSELLKRDMVPTFFDAGMTSTVRAVALAALADRGRLPARELERYRPNLKLMSLFGKANFLEAAVKAKAPAATAKEAADLILSNTIQSAGKVSFNERLGDSYRQLLATPLRDQCAVLAAFVAYGETPEGGKLLGDLPFRLVRTIVQARGNRDHWENTQENAFCMNALLEYSRVYEKDTPAFTVKALIGTEALGEARFAAFRDPARTLSRAIRADDPGASRVLELDLTGTGRMYYAARMTYVPTGPLATNVNAGIEVRREHSVERDGKWVLLTDPMQLKRGELVRVDVFVSVPTARHMVVVDDPVPGGLEPVNRDLATASDVDADKGGQYPAAGGSWWFSHGDWEEFGLSEWSFYHRELRHDAVRWYADYLPAGNYHLAYTAQAIATGRFSVMPLKAEEMYDPDVFGRSTPATLEVGEE